MVGLLLCILCYSKTILFMKGRSPMKRTKLCDRKLPNYTRGEELMNMITHIVGGALGVVALLTCVVWAALKDNYYGIVSCTIYGTTFITMFTISSVYHGLPPGIGKKVMQVIDHCTIYFLIAGTYTAVVLSAIRPVNPTLGWGLFIFEWTLALIGATLTAIDLHKYSIFAMSCYIGMGWAVIFFWRQTLEVMHLPGFLLLLGGGIAYTIGSVLYGLGKTRKWMHSVFHIFVVLGALLQYFAVLCYAI